MLATQLILIIALGIILYQHRRHRELEQRFEEDHGHLYRVMADADELQRRWSTVHRRVEHQRHEIARAQEGYHELFKLLKTSVSIDVGGRHDCGWLIFIAKINGKDAVRIQHLKPNMSMKEYKDLVERLSYDCQHVAYIDGPMHIEEFLRPVGNDPLQRRKRRW